MNISRRLFIGLLTAIPALEKGLGKIAPRKDWREEPLELGPSCRRFVTTSRTVHGPARIYEFSLLGAGGRFSIKRRLPPQSTLIQFGCDPRGGYRWVSMPGHEIVLSPDDSLTLTQQIIPGWDAGTIQCVWHLERPDESGTFPDEIVFNPRDDDDQEEQWDSGNDTDDEEWGDDAEDSPGDIPMD